MFLVLLQVRGFCGVSLVYLSKEKKLNVLVGWCMWKTEHLLLAPLRLLTLLLSQHPEALAVAITYKLVIAN